MPSNTSGLLDLSLRNRSERSSTSWPLASWSQIFGWNGATDRLAVAGDVVLIADYKSDRSVPARLDEVAPYVAQLALYRGVLARLYPDKTVRAALVFTEGPLLLDVPAAAMDAALDKLPAEGRKQLP